MKLQFPEAVLHIGKLTLYVLEEGDGGDDCSNSSSSSTKPPNSPVPAVHKKLPRIGSKTNLQAYFNQNNPIVMHHHSMIGDFESDDDIPGSVTNSSPIRQHTISSQENAQFYLSSSTSTRKGECNVCLPGNNSRSSSPHEIYIPVENDCSHNNHHHLAYKALIHGSVSTSHHYHSLSHSHSHNQGHSLGHNQSHNHNHIHTHTHILNLGTHQTGRDSPTVKLKYCRKLVDLHEKRDALIKRINVLEKIDTFQEGCKSIIMIKEKTCNLKLEFAANSGAKSSQPNSHALPPPAPTISSNNQLKKSPSSSSLTSKKKSCGKDLEKIMKEIEKTETKIIDILAPPTIWKKFANATTVTHS